MKTNQEILQEVAQLPARERAAVIAHYIYMKTAENTGWGKRVPTEWNRLEPDAQEFNLASVDTWANEPDLYDAWRDALRQLQEGRK